MDDPANACPLRFFTVLPDPRAANVRHRLIDILVIALCAMICDADGWDDIEDFAKAKADWLVTFLDLRHGVPSADTFRRVISRLDPEAFERAFMQWMSAVVKQSRGRLLAIDGKRIRRSFERGWDKSGMAHLVSAFATHNGQTLAQLKTQDKGGELAGIKQLLGLIDLRDATVTIDAIGCQKAIARQITDAGGHYVLAVKDNQKTLHRKVRTELDDLIRRRFEDVRYDRDESTDAGHGRIETRRVWVTDELSWLKQAGDLAGSDERGGGRVRPRGDRPQPQRRASVLHLIAEARCPTVGRGDPRSLGHREWFAPRAGRELPRRRQPHPHRPRPRKRQPPTPDRPEPLEGRRWLHQTQKHPRPPQNRRLGPPVPPAPDRRLTICADPEYTPFLHTLFLQSMHKGV